MTSVNSIKTFTIKKWEEEVLESFSPVLVDFQAPSGPFDFFEKLKTERFVERWGNMVSIGTLDLSACIDRGFLSRNFELPALALMDHGKILKSFQGASRVRDMVRQIFTLDGLRLIGILSEQGKGGDYDSGKTVGV
jgi:hypothetical protein